MLYVSLCVVLLKQLHVSTEKIERAETSTKGHLKCQLSEALVSSLEMLEMPQVNFP